jgi:hypothetical protein
LLGSYRLTGYKDTYAYLKHTFTCPCHPHPLTYRWHPHSQVIKDIALAEPLVDVVDQRAIVTNHVPILTIDVLTCKKVPRRSDFRTYTLASPSSFP